MTNRTVQLASSCCGVQPLSSVERRNRSKKQRVSIDCPAIFDMYNNSMGVADAVDALTYYYCLIHIKSKNIIYEFFSFGGFVRSQRMAAVPKRLQII